MRKDEDDGLSFTFDKCSWCGKFVPLADMFIVTSMRMINFNWSPWLQEQDILIFCNEQCATNYFVEP